MNGIKLTTEEFIKKAREFHGDKYDYSLVDYKNAYTKIKIICPIHGEFEQRPNNHLDGRGCIKCANQNKGKKISKTNTKNTDYFINKSKEIHGDKYDYSKVNYINNRTKVEIICPKHGSFFIRPDSHTSDKRGCPKCGKESRFLTNEEVIKQFKEVHGDKYDYSKVNYVNDRTKVEIICPKHGSFWQIPNSHKCGSGCPYCFNSMGEIKIKKWLIDKNINFKQQFKFKECKNKLPLPFDFYLTDKNILIEFDGVQHYKSVNRFGGFKKFKETQKNDEIKNNFCKTNNIKLIRISYKEIKKIENILEEEITS